ncbi:MAG TPA: DJ-1/PfpI family protein [Chitinophagaceae bacterium]|nr:DJ-1/PfpI family protein [Chitinophagaceae bacterium]
MVVGMIIFPGLTQLDLTGPYDVLTRLQGTKVLLIAETMAVVKSDAGLVLTPDVAFDQAPQVDILFVPGGRGVFEAMQNSRLIQFLQTQAAKAKYVTSVCTGALVLAAAGLLNGYKATTHWLSLHLLRLFKVDVVEERVVIDRNRITGGGVTAGIDFGLYLVSMVAGENAAKEIQLMMEYNPAPPFNAGSPHTAGENIVARVVEQRKAVQEAREEMIKTKILG